MITIPDDHIPPAPSLGSKATYRADLSRRATRIGWLWDSFHQQGNLAAGVEACREVRRLAGIAPLFGLANLGMNALDTEEAMARALSGPESLPLVNRQLLLLLDRMDLAAAPSFAEAS